MTDQSDLIALTADIVSAHVSNNSVPTSEVAALIHSTYRALSEAGAPAPEPEVAPEPAVAVRSSVKHDYIVCLEDGKKLKMLKRYLRTNYNMTPEEYRAKWKLPRDYPMVAPAYAEQRRGLAKQIGLGRKAAEPASVPKAKAAPKAVPKAAAKAPAKTTTAKAPRARKAAPAKA
jgi:predicted transcriptional regulator